MLQHAHWEVPAPAETPETRQPALRLVEVGGLKKAANISERRLRRQRRQAEGRYRAPIGWRISTW